MTTGVGRAVLRVSAANGLDRRYVLRSGQSFVVGRQHDDRVATISLPDSKISRRHARLDLARGGLFVTDLESMNGTFLGGTRLVPGVRTPLSDEQPIRLGGHTISAHLDAEAADAPALSNRALLKLLALSEDKYELRGHIATGSKSHIWAAKHLPSKRLVAIKVLRQSLLGGPACQRFVRKARLAQRVDSNYVVKLLDVRVAIDGRPFLIMELIQGQSAQDRIDCEGPMPISAALRCGADIARALEAAGKVGIVHRDVSPHNVLFSPVGVAKLCGFGMARVVAEGVTSLRETGEAEGLSSVCYMAPEQFEERAEHAADFYGLGATLYCMLGGRPPFLSRGPTDLPDLWRRITEESPPRLSSLRAEVPSAIAILVHQLLAKSPQARPQSGGAIAEQLLAAASSVPVERVARKHKATRAFQTPQAPPET